MNLESKRVITSLCTTARHLSSSFLFGFATGFACGKMVKWWHRKPGSMPGMSVGHHAKRSTLIVSTQVIWARVCLFVLLLTFVTCSRRGFKGQSYIGSLKESLASPRNSTLRSRSIVLSLGIVFEMWKHYLMPWSSFCVDGSKRDFYSVTIIWVALVSSWLVGGTYGCGVWTLQLRVRWELFVQSKCYKTSRLQQWDTKSWWCGVPLGFWKLSVGPYSLWYGLFHLWTEQRL